MLTFTGLHGATYMYELGLFWVLFGRICFFSYKWATPCENVSTGIFGQLSPDQPDQGLYCSPTELSGTTQCIYEWKAKARMILCACAV